MEKISICPDLFLREFLKLSVKFRKSRYFDLYKTMITAFPSNSRTSYMSVQIISLFNEVLTCFSSIYTVLREFDDPHVIHRTIFKATKNHTKSSINYTYVNKKCNRRILIRVGKLIPGSLLPGLFFFRALLTNKEETRVFIRPDPFKEQPYLNDRKSTICTFLSASNMTLSFFVRIVSVYVFVNDVDM
jgi:hypothetical protein